MATSAGGSPMDLAASATGVEVSLDPRPAGLGARVATSVTSCRESTSASRDGTLQRSLPRKTIEERFNLTGDDAGQYHAIIKDGKLEVKEGTHPSPKMTMTMAGKDYVDLTLGKLNGQMAFMQGKLKIAGDMGLAMKMQTLFKNA